MEFYRNLDYDPLNNNHIYTMMINRPKKVNHHPNPTPTEYIINVRLNLSYFIHYFDNFFEYRKCIDLNPHTSFRIDMEEYIGMTGRLYLEGIKNNNLYCYDAMGNKIKTPILRYSQLKT